MFLMIFSFISSAYCADVLPRGDNVFSGYKRPPHQQIKTYNEFLKGKSDAPFSNIFCINEKQKKDATVAVDPHFDEKRSHFERLSSSPDNNPNALVAQLKQQCTSLHTRTTLPTNPLDAFIVERDNELNQQLQKIIQTVGQISPHSLHKINQLPQSHLAHTCKLLIYIANQLNFSNISIEQAPYQLNGISPAQQRSRYYLNKIDKPWLTPAILPEDLAYSSSDKGRHTTWVANLLIALKQSQCKKTQQKSHVILQRFLEVLPNLKKASPNLEKALLNLKEAPLKLEGAFLKFEKELSKLEDEPLKLEVVFPNLKKAFLNLEKALLNREEAPLKLEESLFNLEEKLPKPKNTPRLDTIYHDALTTEFICKDTNETVFVNQKLGFITAMLVKQSTPYNKQTKLHCSTFIAKYLGLYQ